MHLGSDYSYEEDYTFHIKNGKDVSYNAKEKIHSHKYKKDRGKYKFGGIHRRGNKIPLIDSEEISSYSLRKMHGNNRSKENEITKKNSSENSSQIYVTFPVITRSKTGEFKTLYATKSLEEFSEYKLSLILLRAHFQRKGRDSDGLFHVLLFEREIEKAKDYHKATQIMDFCLKEDSQLARMIEGSYYA